MFRFFRRHQKILMTAVAAMSAFSFSFYGLYSTFLGESRHAEPTSGELTDGTPIRQSRRDALRQILALEASMDVGRDGAVLPNVLNAGIITGEILKAGLGPVVLERQREKIQQEWRDILAQQRSYKFYRHPVRAQVGWKQAVGYADPGLLALVETLPEQLDDSFLDHQLALIEASSRCPSALVHQVLLGMERQARLAHDPALDRAELRLFGHKNLEDWLGQTFLNGCVNLVLEAAHAASVEGQKIRAHDVRTEWLKGLSSLKSQGVEAPQALRWLLAHLRVSEGQAVDGWGQVMLFQRWINTAIQGAIARDSSLKQEVVTALERSRERARVQVVKSPLVLRSLGDLALFEIYLEGVGRTRAQILDLPSEMLSVEQVRRRAPELVSERVEVRLAKADKEALMAQIPIRDLLSWQVSDEGWSILGSRLRELLSKEAVTPETRRDALLALDVSQQAQATRLAQEYWLKGHPELVKEALDEASVETLVWDLSAAALPGPLPGLPATSTMLTWVNRDGPFEVPTEGRFAFRFESIRAIEAAQVLDYLPAMRSGALSALLQRRLREDWDLLKSMADPLVEKAQKMEEVADKLLQRRTGKVLTALQAYVAETLGKSLERTEDLIPYRLAAQLTAKRGEGRLDKQFSASQEEVTVIRGAAPRHLAFELADGEWSLPHLDADGHVLRIQVLDRSAPTAQLDLQDPAALDVLRVTKQNLARHLLKGQGV